jgi:hypothetical protein
MMKIVMMAMVNGGKSECVDVLFVVGGGKSTVTTFER